MLVLAIESSSQVAGAAIVDEERIISECVLNKGLKHSEVLMPIIDSVFSMGDVEVSDIDLFAVSKGPGSFTGLRIGIATAKGLAQSVNRPVIGVPTLDGLAYNIQYTSHIICPMLDARRGEVYTSIYQYEADTLVRKWEYMAISLRELMDNILPKDGKVVFLGDGTIAYRNLIKEHMKDRAIIAPPIFINQRASSIAQVAIELARGGHMEDFRELEPFYLRKSQAERSLAGKEKQT